MARRPEHEAPPDVYYDEDMASKYASSSRMIEIQTQMSERAIELMNLNTEDGPLLLLDLGCGSGLSGSVLSASGHQWVGLDISSAMLRIAMQRGVEGDIIQRDLGDGLPFRAGTFDGAVSISAIQWLCNVDKSTHNAHHRLNVFFGSLYACLKRHSRAVFQLYPETPQQMELITASAMKAGFTGGLVVDYPHSTKAKKFFLTLFAGPPPPGYKEPTPLGVDEDPVFAPFQTRARDSKKKGKEPNHRVPIKSKEWILNKKEKQKAQGKDVRPDSKYTGRKRKRAF
ncbi:ribosome biogenesis methyltransferase WBSCR22 [Pelomyxa schiedti]|nr:ribosome biogenesis methyltransferase WBSCR22 [Pelomyxa schiedti]